MYEVLPDQIELLIFIFQRIKLLIFLYSSKAGEELYGVYKIM